ncbi:MAG: choice-of-anchor Q domain-containing protein, partial [Chloroflexota bacterium]
MTNTARILLLIVLLSLVLSGWDLTPARAASLTDPCLSAITVTSNADNGAASLRQAVADACSGGTINFAFAAPITITLFSTIELNKDLTISGPGADHLSISGGDVIEPFKVASGVTVDIEGLTIQNGNVLVANVIQEVSGFSLYYKYGGAILNQGNLTVRESAFYGNTADNAGGAIMNYNGTLSIVDSTFIGNSSPAATFGYGGAVGSVGTLTVQNSTFSGNSAGTGGGIFAQTTVSIQNSTITGNTANSAGGIYYAATDAIITNTIIAHSVSGNDCDGLGTVLTNSHNLVQDGSCSSTYSGDPDLGLPGLYGGHTVTIPLLSGSPAIGQGSSCLESDQRGLTRGSTCDIGAYQTTGFLARTRPASDPTGDSTTLNGTVNANNASATVTFEYGPT